MPMYDFRCSVCYALTEQFRSIGKRDNLDTCDFCSGDLERVMINAPVAQVWNADRRFPNLSPHGDGSMAFNSKIDYETHLKANGWIDNGVYRAPLVKSHGNKVVGVWNNAGERLR